MMWAIVFDVLGVFYAGITAFFLLMALQEQGRRGLFSQPLLLLPGWIAGLMWPLVAPVVLISALRSSGR